MLFIIAVHRLDIFSNRRVVNCFVDKFRNPLFYCERYYLHELDIAVMTEGFFLIVTFFGKGFFCANYY